MGVVLLAGHEPAQHPDEILEEAGLELVHSHHARRVRRVDAGDPVRDAALEDELAHLLGDVADLEAAARAQASLCLEDLHSNGLRAGPVDGTVKLRDMRHYSYHPGARTRREPSGPVAQLVRAAD